MGRGPTVVLASAALLAGAIALLLLVDGRRNLASPGLQTGSVGQVETLRSHPHLESAVVTAAPGRGKLKAANADRVRELVDVAPPSYRVTDETGAPIPNPEFATVREDVVVAHVVGDEHGNIWLPEGIESWHSLVGARDFTPVEVALPSAGRTLNVRLSGLAPNYMRVTGLDGKAPPEGWSLKAHNDPLAAECFSWFERLAIEAPVDPHNSWFSLPEIKVFRAPLLELVAPDGCRCINFAVISHTIREHVETGERTANVPPMATGYVESIRTLRAPRHPSHDAYRLVFLDEHGAPIADASLSFGQGRYEISGGTTDAAGAVVLDVWFGWNWAEAADISAALVLPGGEVWRVNFSSAALIEAGELVFSRARAELAFELVGPRASEFSVAVGVMHGVGFEQEQEPRVNFHRSVEKLEWQAASDAGRVAVQVPRGLGQFCGFVRHDATGLVVGGMCGLDPTATLRVELPELSLVRVQVEGAEDASWEVALDPHRVDPHLQTTKGAPTFAPGTLELEMPVGTFGVEVSTGRHDWELKPVEVVPGEVVLDVELSVPTQVAGFVHDTFGDPVGRGRLDYRVPHMRDLWTHLPGSGEFTFEVLREEDLDELELEFHGGVPKGQVELLTAWTPEGVLDVEVRGGRLNLEFDFSRSVAWGLSAELHHLESGTVEDIYLGGWKSNAVVAPGHYELRFNVLRGAPRTFAFEVQVGAMTTVNIDFEALCLMSLELRSRLILDLELAFLGEAEEPSVVETSVVPIERCIETFLVHPGTYRLRMACSRQVEDEHALLAQFEREFVVEQSQHFEIDLDEEVRLGLERFVPRRPELASLAQLLE